MNTYDLNKKEYLALREAIVDAIEAEQVGLAVGELLLLKSVGRLRQQMLGLKKPCYIVARISLDNLSNKQRKALQDLGWSHHFVLQDILALGSLASVIGLAKGRLGWIAGGFAAGLTAMGIEKMPHWKYWESFSESFDYESIADALIEANAILLDGKLSILRIDPISEKDAKIKKKMKHKNKNDATL